MADDVSPECGVSQERQKGLEQLRALVQEAEEDIAAGRIGYFDVDATMRRVRAVLQSQKQSKVVR